MLRLASCSGVYTVIEIGTSCSRSSLRRAVTTISAGFSSVACGWFCAAGGLVVLLVVCPAGCASAGTGKAIMHTADANRLFLNVMVFLPEHWFLAIAQPAP